MRQEWTRNHEQKIKDLLVNHGLFPKDADAIIAAMKADEASEAMRGRWGDDMEGYPPQLMPVVWLSARRHALEWIDANCPKAWYRPLFAPESEPPANTMA